MIPWILYRDKYCYKFCLVEPKILSTRILSELAKVAVLIPLTGSVGDPWHFGADPDPDPLIHTSKYGSGSGSNSGSDSFLRWLSGCKKIFFFQLFSYNLPTGTFPSFLKILLKYWVKIYFASIISFRSIHLWEKGRIWEAQKHPDPQHCIEVWIATNRY
jgi:hypothetical protein